MENSLVNVPRAPGGGRGEKANGWVEKQLEMTKVPPKEAEGGGLWLSLDSEGISFIVSSDLTECKLKWR